MSKDWRVLFDGEGPAGPRMVAVQILMGRKRQRPSKIEEGLSRLKPAGWSE